MTKLYSSKSNAKRALAAMADSTGFEVASAEGGRWMVRAVPAPAPRAPARHQGRRAAVRAAAAAGQLPAPPDFTAPTHKPYRARLAQLIALAEAGDAAGLQAVEIKPYSSSPKALARYRDLVVAALAARQGAAGAAQ